MTEALPRLTVGFIQNHVAQAYGLDPRLMTSGRRSKSIARPRQVAMWLAKELLPGYSLPQIGRAFGGRDHTTIMKGVRKVSEIRAHDRTFAETVDTLRIAIVEATTPPAPTTAAAERMANSLATAFENAVVTLARRDPAAALQAFTPLAQGLGIKLPEPEDAAR